jgi:serine/threonine protein kinase
LIELLANQILIRKLNAISILDEFTIYFDRHSDNRTNFLALFLHSVWMQIGDYKIEREIGRGSFATVYKGIGKNGDIVAIKSVQKSKLNRKLAENLEVEIAILHTIKHDNIVRLYETHVGEFYVENRPADPSSHGILRAWRP